MTDRDRRTEPGRGGGLLWLVLVGAIVALVAVLANAFPEAVRTRDDWMSVAYTSGVVLLVSTAIFRLRGGALRQHAKYAIGWIVIIAVLVLGYAYRDVFSDTRQRLALAFSGGAPVAGAERELIIPATESGAFVVVGEVNGERVRFVVDTGATDTVLSPDDARRIGLDLAMLRFDQKAETANGVGLSAAYRAESLAIGPILFRDVDVSVNQAPLTISLLGMSFLRKLESFEVRGDRLYMRWREGVVS